ncbi:hypothetical protein BGZ49_001810, partial [Haplosporangium sp. Z 27]
RLCTDLPALHSLLLVNKFFFHATIPYLYHDPPATWGMNSASNKYSADRNKFFALVFVSFLQARLEELPWDSGDDQQADKLLDRILKPFGLKLIRPFQSSGLDMLDSIASCFSSLYPTNGIISHRWKDYPRRLTIDYSKFLSSLSPDDWRLFPFFTVVRLRKLPYYMRRSAYEYDLTTEENIGDDNESNAEATTAATEVMTHENETGDEEIRQTECENEYTGDINDNTDSDDDQHSIDGERDQEYTWPLRESLVDLWLHFNFDSITSFFFEMPKSQKYLALSTKLASIEIIYLNRERAMPDSQLENTVLFIKQNQASFPMKRIMDVQLGFNWGLYDDVGVDWSMMDLNTYKAERWEYREKSFQYMKPAITIFEAVGKPHKLDVGEIPYFYKYARNIELENLAEFSDSDLERISCGEGPEREDFLRRCDNLRKLNLGVESHDIFSWLVEEVRDSTLSTRRSLRKIDTLELWNHDSYNSAIQAFNDAMFVFSESLRTISLRAHHNSRGVLPIELRNTLIMESLQLHKRASATTIGDWSLSLPWLRAISIQFHGVVNIEFGSLDKCQNLESLEIGFGYSSPEGFRPEGTAPLTIPDPSELLDPRWAQAKMDCTLYPIWNLPRLKKLHLLGMAALRFDFGSILGMRRLETLSLGVDGNSFWGQSLDEYIARQAIFQSLQPHYNSDYRPGHIHGTLDSDTTKSWILPELKTISLQGPPSTMFCLDLLKSFPKLESVELNGIFTHRQISRHKLSRKKVTHQSYYLEGTIFMEATCQNEAKNLDDEIRDADDKTRDTEDKVKSSDYDETPYLESHLRKFSLYGGWSISAQDTTSLLTTYAPFLEELTIGQLGNFESQNGYWFLQAIKDADEINKTYTAAENSNVDGGSGPFALRNHQRGRNLTSVNCKYWLKKKDKNKLGLRKISDVTSRFLKECGLRSYKLLYHYFAHLEDFEIANQKARSLDHGL